MIYFTTAPADYDYWYVDTVAPASVAGWRVIKVVDLDRFERFQVPRYSSGLHAALKADSPEARAVGLVAPSQ